MSFVGHAFVDWDDTVAENIQYFNQTESRTSALIARVTGFDAAEVARRGAELDVITARRLGLIKESLSTAWQDCYREFAQRAGLTPDPAVLDELWRLCQFPYQVKQDLLPGAAETLRWLEGNGYEITIWTAGEESIQSRKIGESGLEHLVHRKRIVLDKTPERLLDAMEDRDPNRTFVVGNSLHSDIRPALAVGIRAYHIQVETWGYDQSKVDTTDPRYHAIAGLGELPRALGLSRQVG